MDIKQTSCRQCGICCTKGGAALHSSDITLIDAGSIPRKDLVTLRKGEFAYNPVSNSVLATDSEIVKLRGTGKEWTCCYYNAEMQDCTIYENRPMACGVLRCWDSEESLALVGHNLLSRLEIVRHEESLIQIITEYETDCPLPDLGKIPDALLENPEKILPHLEEIINRDLQFRDNAVAQSLIILEQEMFLFGRPVFQILQAFGLTVTQSGNRLFLKVQK